MSPFTRWLRAEWDRVAGYTCLAAGFVALLVGIFGVRRSADVIDEVAYLVSGGIGGMFLLGVGSVLLLSADLHDDFRKLHRVEENQRRLEDKLDRISRLLAAEHPDFDLTDVIPGRDERGPDAVAEHTAPADRPMAEAAAPARAVRQGRMLASAGIVGAGALFGAGWWQAATETRTDGLPGGVGLALAGALLVALVAAVLVAWLGASLERRKLAVLGAWMATPVAAGPEASPAATGAVWVVDGLELYHRAGCVALEGRTATEVPRDRAASERRPCGHCRPG